MLWQSPSLHGMDAAGPRRRAAVGRISQWEPNRGGREYREKNNNTPMKLITTTLAAALVLASALTIHAADQLWATVDYMHIPESSSADDYIAMEKIHMKRHQKLVDAGICKAWSLYRVENGGRNDFVTVRVYDSLDKMAAPWPDSIRQGLFNSEEQAKLNKTSEIRDLTHTEL